MTAVPAWWWRYPMGAYGWLVPKSHWRSQRADDLGGAAVFVHPELADVRIQPGQHDADGQRWEHGVHVAMLVDGEWVPVEGGSFFWVHEAQEWAERELLS